MYRLLIVDDEMAIREGIKNSIKWSDYEVSSVKAVASGEEAIEALTNFSPHIILCDIKMYDVSGFDVLREINTMNNNIKLIFLTAHDDFNYAQLAVKLNAFDYILKTSSAEEIIEVIQKAIIKIKEEAVDLSSEYQIEDFIDKHQGSLRNIYLNNIIGGKLENNSRNSQVLKYDKDLKSIIEIGYFKVSIIRLGLSSNFQSEEDNLDQINNEILDHWEKTLKNDSIVFRNEKTDNVIIKKFTCNYEDELEEQVFHDKCCELYDEITKKYNVTLSIGVSNMYKSDDHIKKAYDESLTSIKYLTTLEPNIVNYREVEDHSRIKLTITDGEERELVRAIKSFENKKIEKVIDNILKRVESNKIVDRREIMNLFIELYAINRKILKLSDVEAYYDRINNTYSYWELKKIIYNLCYKTSENIVNENITKERTSVQCIYEYIQENFKENITLEDAASKVFLSPNYFSKLFSDEIGMSFLQYITNCRVEEAKLMLLNKNYKVYEIGENVGYSNPHYFSRIFKKQTGMSPIQYREHMMNL